MRQHFTVTDRPDMRYRPAQLQHGQYCWTTAVAPALSYRSTLQAGTWVLAPLKPG
jgi:hypothetical protein